MVQSTSVPITPQNNYGKCYTLSYISFSCSAFLGTLLNRPPDSYLSVKNFGEKKNHSCPHSSSTISFHVQNSVDVTSRNNTLAVSVM